MKHASATPAQTAYKSLIARKTVRLQVWWHPARDLDLPVIRWELMTRPPHVVLHHRYERRAA
jgi:hypothetical protein